MLRAHPNCVGFKTTSVAPDYSLYNDFIEKTTGGDEKQKKRKWDDYLSYSIGFTTRGCIRHCGFCVNRLQNRVVEWSPVSEFLDESRKRIYLWPPSFPVPGILQARTLEWVAISFSNA